MTKERKKDSNKKRISVIGYAYFYDHESLSILFRDNLVLLQVGFKSLSYEMEEQQPAYDIW